MRKYRYRIVSVLKDGAEVDLSRALLHVVTHVSMDALFGTFQFEAFVRVLQHGIADAGGKVDIRVCDETTGGGEHRFVGLVDRVSRRTRTSGVIASISGRSYAAIITESPVSRHRYSYTSGLTEVISTICEELGVGTVIPRAEPVSGTVEFGNITVFEAVKHLASHEGLAMRVQPDGETIDFTKGLARGPSKEADHAISLQDIRGAIEYTELRLPEVGLDDWQ